MPFGIIPQRGLTFLEVQNNFHLSRLKWQVPSWFMVATAVVLSTISLMCFADTSSEKECREIEQQGSPSSWYHGWPRLGSTSPLLSYHQEMHPILTRRHQWSWWCQSLHGLQDCMPWKWSQSTTECLILLHLTKSWTCQNFLHFVSRHKFFPSQGPYNVGLHTWLQESWRSYALIAGPHPK